MQGQGKIFGIGLSKTCTTSLTRALRILDYNTIHYPFFQLDHSSPRAPLIENKLIADAYTDIPIPLYYQELDKKFPNSKFILTLRNMEDWLTSCERYHIWPGDYMHNKALGRFRYIRSVLHLHHQIFGSVCFDRKTFQRSHERHLQEVRDYFKDRPQDLLEIDIRKGEGWEKLCPFLNKETPREAFPRKNVGQNKTIKRLSRKWSWQALSALHLGIKSSNGFEKLPTRLQGALE